MPPSKTLQRAFPLCNHKTDGTGLKPIRPRLSTSTPLLNCGASSLSFPGTRYRTIRSARKTNLVHTRIAFTPDTNQTCPTSRRRAPTSRRPSPSSTSAATAVSPFPTLVISSEHAVKILPSQRSRTLKARWAVTVRESINAIERQEQEY
jgi:hypothetical protein